jgi:hypothetical protein
VGGPSKDQVAAFPCGSLATRISGYPNPASVLPHICGVGRPRMRKRLAPQTNPLPKAPRLARLSASVSYAGLGPGSESRASAITLLLSSRGRVLPTNTPRSGRGSALGDDEAMAVPKHRIYRLGDHLAARLPRIGRATEQESKEAKWLPKSRRTCRSRFRCSWRWGIRLRATPSNGPLPVVDRR